MQKRLEAGMTDPTHFITGLSKVDFHVHLEGTLEPALTRALALLNNPPIPA